MKAVLRFGIALERVTYGSYEPGTFLHDRISAAGLRPMPMFTIGDLWQIEKLLVGEGQRFHYLLRRAELDEEISFVADEQDLLALYLMNGFNDARTMGRTLEIYGLSAKLAYYQKGTPHYDPRTPLPVSTSPLWRHLIAQGRAAQRSRWRMIAYDLLNFMTEEQERFRTDLVAAKRMIRAHGSRKGLTVNKVFKSSIRHPIELVCVTGAKLDTPGNQRELDGVWRGLTTEHPHARLILLHHDVAAKKPYPSLWRYHGTPWADIGANGAGLSGFRANADATSVD